jgi:hypothetical protein
MAYGIGRCGFNLMTRQKRHVLAKLYIKDDLAKIFLGLLKIMPVTLRGSW